MWVPQVEGDVIRYSSISISYLVFFLSNTWDGCMPFTSLFSASASTYIHSHFFKKSDKTRSIMDDILHSIAPGKKDRKAKGKRKPRTKVRNTLCVLERNRSFLLKTGRWDRVSGNQQ